MDIVRNPNLKFMEQSTVIDRTLPIGVRVSDQIKAHDQFCTMFI